jgi:N-acyl-D-amino-acid deacylase
MKKQSFLYTRLTIILSICFLMIGLIGCAGDRSASHDDLLSEADIIIREGRVIDPETGRDEIATVGVKDGIITVITTDPVETYPSTETRRVIDARNLVVSPGFINTHTHEGIWEESMKAYVSDGITTWIGGNCGASGGAPGTVAEFMDTMEAARMFNNYAALTGHISLRRAVGVEQFGDASEEQVQQMVDLLQDDLDAGGWGVSFGAFYDPGCATETMLRLAQTSKDNGGMAASHIRYNLMRIGSLILYSDVLEEAVDTCRQTGVPFIVSHLTDVTYNNTTEYALDQILDAIETENLPLAADIIGYNSFSNDFYTILGYGTVPVILGLAATGLSISDFQVLEDVYINGIPYMKKYDYFKWIWQAQLLSYAIGEGFAESPRVWCYIVKPENTKTALKRSYVFMGNDGSVGRNSETGELDGQPRSVACFSRLFGHWVRQEGTITFMQAMYKSTLAPALWLGLEKKGRLQVGCDADITLFDPDTIIDRASPTPGEHLLPPDGIPYVIVNGVLVVDEGDLTGNRPGQVLRRTWTVPGDTSQVIESGNVYDSE